MPRNLLVSVITPSFNQAKFLEETLRSVELQNHRPIHQIVIDGGSTDGTVDLLKGWAARDHGPGYAFEWISEADRGHADAMNKGFARAQGEIVGWLNSDDVYFDRHVISTSVAALSVHPEIDVVHGDVAMISEDSGLQMIWCFPEFDYERALRGYIIPQPTVFFRRCVTDKHRLDPTSWGAIDHAYWLQIGREHKFHKISRVQAGDRDHGARITQVSNHQLMAAGKKLCETYGGGKEVGWAARAYDRMWKALMRGRGVLHAILLLARHRLHPQDVAFPVWIDSAPNLLKRQLTMRIFPRASMGSRPKDTKHFYAEN
jgi:glycosyltransferase involved in cell wall biosynthesis